MQLASCCRAEIFQLLVALIMLGVSVLFDQVQIEQHAADSSCLCDSMMIMYLTSTESMLQVPFSGFGMMTRAIHTITFTR
jgi:hypothetical protein